MRIASKVQGFTLQEMVITMIISTIVIGLAFSVLTMVQRHMWSIQKNFELNTEYNRLEQALWIDINTHTSISFNAKENQLQCKTPLDSITYQFQLDYVLRNQDTFRISILKKSLFFDGEQVVEGSLDALKLKLRKNPDDQNLFIFKPNDATVYID